MTKVKRDIDRVFIWRGRGGRRTPVNQMTTSHLFYTLRMVWNHSAPDAIKIRPYNRYIFGPEFTRSYMELAVKSIGRELMIRDDRTSEMEEQLEFMRSNWLAYCDNSLRRNDEPTGIRHGGERPT